MGIRLTLLAGTGLACGTNSGRDGIEVPDTPSDGEADLADHGEEEGVADVSPDHGEFVEGSPDDNLHSDAIDAIPPPCGMDPVRITPEGRNVGGGWVVSDGYLSYGTVQYDARWLLNVATGEEEHVCAAAGMSAGETCGRGFVHGGRLVWTESTRPIGETLWETRTYIRDSSLETRRLLWDSAEHEGKRVLPWGFNGTYLLWEKSAPYPPRDPVTEIHLLNVDTLEDRIIASGTYPWSVMTQMDLWGDRFVYLELVDSSRARVMLHQISTGVTTAIGDSPCDHYDPAIWEDRVAWLDSRNEECTGGYWTCENPDVYIRFLGGGGQIVENEGSIQQNVDIFGDWVVWDDERNDVTPNISDAMGPDGRLEVYAHNVATGETRLLSGTIPGTGAGNPQMWDGRALFDVQVDGATPEYAIYMVCLE